MFVSCAIELDSICANKEIIIIIIINIEICTVHINM